MKKIIAFIVFLVLLVVAFHAGKIHALNDSQVWIEDNEILIEIDGNLYAHEIQ